MSSQKEHTVTEDEIDYWCEEYPDLTREEVTEILTVLDISSVKDIFWKDNPTLPEDAVNKVVATSVASSYEYHLYRELNNEAS